MKLRITMLFLVLLGAQMNASQESAGHKEYCHSMVIEVPQYAIDNHECGSTLLSEKDVRQRIYWLDENNPAFYKQESIQKDLDYYIAIFGNHIKVLENEIVQNKSLDKVPLWNRNNEAGHAMRLSILAAVSSLTTAIGACIALKELDMFAAVGFGGISTLCAFLATGSFDKASHYDELLVTRLERDKRILAVLEAEKVARQANSLNNIIAEDAAAKILEAVKTVVEGIEGFFKPKKAA